MNKPVCLHVKHRFEYQQDIGCPIPELLATPIIRVVEGIEAKPNGVEAFDEVLAWISEALRVSHGDEWQHHDDAIRLLEIAQKAGK